MFRNFYVGTPTRGEFDAFSDGENSCAFFVSSVLVIFKKISGIHGTVESVRKDLRESGWLEVNEPKEGDVLIWEKQKFEDGWKEHIGFYIGSGRAISTSSSKKTPLKHELNFSSGKREVVQIFRMINWNDAQKS